LFGTKPGSEDAKPGEIYLENDQQALQNIDMDRLRSTVSDVRKRLGYDTYDVSLVLVDDEEMQETNLETRGINSPTDILSFPFHPAVRPGKLQEPEFDIPDFYNLGDMLIDVPYVIRRCEEDREYFEGKENEYEGEESGEEEDDDVGDDEEQYEDDDRGVSGAMARIYNPEERLHMLLVHGMLHLVGYDHETDKEYEEMVQKEEEILQAMKLLQTGGDASS
jgi:rRNA maturation RNase YbeY